MKLVAVLVLASFFLILIRQKLLQVDLSFPLFVGLVVLGFASMSHDFIDWIAARFDILDAPRAIIMITIAILLTLYTSLAVAYSRLRHRQILLVRYVVSGKLSAQEKSLNPNSN
jgi:hypothetical protein